MIICKLLSEKLIVLKYINHLTIFSIIFYQTEYFKLDLMATLSIYLINLIEEAIKASKKSDM